MVFFTEIYIFLNPKIHSEVQKTPINQNEFGQKEQIWKHHISW